MPESPTTLLEGTYQPGDQSVGTLDPKTKTVYFLDGTRIVGYNMKGIEGKSIQLKLDDMEDEEALPERNLVYMIQRIKRLNCIIKQPAKKQPPGNCLMICL